VIPVAIVISIVVVVFDFLLRRTTAFRLVYYTGSNEKAAAYSGIRTKRVIFLTTVLCSTLCGVAGMICMARFGSAQPTFGVGMELNVIAAAVIGGASLSGGKGTIFGAILGAVLLSRVVTHAQVSRITLDGRRATGVEWSVDNQSFRARAGAEVILAAGAINSPKLLELFRHRASGASVWPWSAGGA
jgi:ribose/xylose/arabinose/galactoside ABC-type transport system permease subunit